MKKAQSIVGLGVLTPFLPFIMGCLDVSQFPTMDDLRAIETRFVHRAEIFESNIGACMADTTASMQSEMARLEEQQSARLNTIDADSLKMQSLVSGLSLIVDDYIKHPEMALPGRYVNHTYEVVDKSVARIAQRIDDAVEKLSTHSGGAGTPVEFLKLLWDNHRIDVTSKFDQVQQTVAEGLNRIEEQDKELGKSIKDIPKAVKTEAGILFGSLESTFGNMPGYLVLLTFLNLIVIVINIWTKLPDPVKAWIGENLTPKAKKAIEKAPIPTSHD